MWGLFKCKHPAAMLVVQTATPTVKDIGPDFNQVTFHLSCQNCGDPVDVSCATFKHGAEAFLHMVPPPRPDTVSKGETN